MSDSSLLARLFGFRAIFRFYLIRISLTQINSDYFDRLVAYGFADMTPIHRLDVPRAALYQACAFTTVVYLQLA